MTPKTMNAIMARHGLLQVDVARICAVTSRTVYNWATGRQKIPQAVALLLTALDEGTLDLQWFAAKL